MKIEEIIKVLKKMVAFYASFSDKERAVALSGAVLHLKKYIPMNVKKDNRYICPECGYSWNEKRKNLILNYCPNCGQRISYEEE